MSTVSAFGLSSHK